MPDVRPRCPGDVPDLPVGIVEVALFLETRGPDHAAAVEAALADAGFAVGRRSRLLAIESERAARATDLTP